MVIKIEETFVEKALSKIEKSSLSDEEKIRQITLIKSGSCLYIPEKQCFHEKGNKYSCMEHREVGPDHFNAIRSPLVCPYEFVVRCPRLAKRIGVELLLEE